VEHIGIDIGGTGIKGAPVDIATGELTAPRFRIDTPKGAHPDDVAKVVKQVAEHFEVAGPVGITFPGVVLKGVVETAANMAKEWKGCDADSMFTKLLDRPVHMMNDADAAGVAEMRFGAGRDHKGVVVMITLGTGIGAAVFNDGVLLPNTEFGHMEIDGADAELLAAGRIRDELKLSWKDYAKRVQKYLRRLDALIWPDLVIIGGGISKESAKWLSYVDVRCPIAVAAFLNNAGIVGAALTAD
jgi:polyphosphate glucokinase